MAGACFKSIWILIWIGVGYSSFLPLEIAKLIHYAWAFLRINFQWGNINKKLSSHLVDFLAIKVRGKGEGGTESIPKGNVSDYFE